MLALADFGAKTIGKNIKVWELTTKLQFWNIGEMTQRTATNTTRQTIQRNRELGHIHQGKAQLGWSEDDYRYHLHQLTGHLSAATLDNAGRKAVLAHMAKLGYTPKSTTFKPFDQAAKIRWLWAKIGEHGGLRNPTDAGLLAFIETATKLSVSDLRFLPVAEASKAIEALKAMLDRTKRKQRQQPPTT